MECCLQDPQEKVSEFMAEKPILSEVEAQIKHYVVSYFERLTS